VRVLSDWSCLKGGTDVFQLRVKVLLLLLVLLGSTTFGAAEPGGNGDGLRDMQCGGACHGDAGQNATSSLSLSIETPEHVWAGQPTEVTIVVAGVDVSHDEDLVGLFLLSSTNANGDTPLSNGWEILSDGSGGTGNYVERSTDGSGASLQHTWILRADAIGERTLFASVHHGDATGSSQGRPFFGISEAFVINIEPVPEDLPRLHEDFVPPSMREVGEVTLVELQTKFTETVAVEWQTEDGVTLEASVNASGEQVWEFTLPATLKPSSLQWRATFTGQGPEQTTPWFTLAAQVTPAEVDDRPIYIQGLAMGLLLFGAVVALQKPRTNSEDLLKTFDQTVEIQTIQAADSVVEPTSDAPAPLPEGGLPPGWTEEQWAWYGHEYLAGTYGGGQ